MSKVFIISGPTCSGKDTVADMVLSKHPKWKKFTTMTTRPKQKSEDPNSYRFYSKKEFQKMIDNKEMFEWAEVHGYYYGNSKEYINEILDQDFPVIGDVDIQGARTYKKKLGDRVVLIFLKAESFEVLEERIKKRDRGESDTEIIKRLERARVELEHESEFGYSVINPQGKPEEAVSRIEEIVIKEIEKTD
jgi:guanylate kinase